MSSEAQIAANRSNALKSTGPRTAEGKAVSARNHRKSRELILPFESAQEYRALADALRDDLAARNPTESVIVDSIIAAAWRLRRIRTLEAGLFYAGFPTQVKLEPEMEAAVAFRNDCAHFGSRATLSRHEARVERNLHSALQMLEHLRQSNPIEPNSPTELVARVMSVCNT